MHSLQSNNAASAHVLHSDTSKRNVYEVTLLRCVQYASENYVCQNTTVKVSHWQAVQDAKNACSTVTCKMIAAVRQRRVLGVFSSPRFASVEAAACSPLAMWGSCRYASFATLADLAAVEGKRSDFDDAEGGHQPAEFKRRSVERLCFLAPESAAIGGGTRAALHAAGQQLQRVVTRASLIMPRHEFLAHRARIVNELLEVIPRSALVASRNKALSSSQKDANRLCRRVLQRAGAECALQLLLQHRTSPSDAEQTRKLMCALCFEDDGNEADSGQESRRTTTTALPLPLGPTFPHIHASWEASVAVFSWAAVATMPSTHNNSAPLHVLPTSLTRLPTQAAHYVQLSLSQAIFGVAVDDAKVLSSMLSSRDSCPIPAASQHQRDILRWLLTNIAAPVPLSSSPLVPGAEPDHTVATSSPVASSMLDMLQLGSWERALSVFRECVTSSPSAPPVLKKQYLHERLSKDVRKSVRLSAAASHQQQEAFEAHILENVIHTTRRRRNSALDDNGNLFEQQSPAALSVTMPPQSCIRFEGRGPSTLAFTWRHLFWEHFPAAVCAAAASCNDAVIDAFRRDVVLPYWWRHHQQLPQASSPPSVASTVEISEEQKGRSLCDGGYDEAAAPWPPSYHTVGDSLVSLGTAMLSLIVPKLDLHRASIQQILRPPATALMATGDDANEGPRDIAGAVRSFRNYTTSVWLEIMFRLGPVSDALAALRDATDNEKKHIPLVLGPECAAQLATLVFQSALHIWRHVALETDDRVAQEERVWSAIFGHMSDGIIREVHFATPVARSGPSHPAPYFKWMASDSFYSPLMPPVPSSVSGATDHGVGFRVCESSAAKSGSHGDVNLLCYAPLGLLCARSYRPSTQTSSSSVLEGRGSPSSGSLLIGADVWILDLRKVVAAAVSQAQQMSRATNTVTCIGSCCGGDLLAFYKPVNTCTTLHASVPSVAAALATRNYNTNHNRHEQREDSRNAGCDMNFSVLAQEGILNRIDRNTTGLMLVAANTGCALEAWRPKLIRDKQLTKTYMALVKRVSPSDRLIETIFGFRRKSQNNEVGATMASVTPLQGAAHAAGIFFLPPRGLIGGALSADGTSYGHRLASTYRTAAQAQHSPVAVGQRGSVDNLRFGSTQYQVLEFFPSRGGIYWVRVTIRSGRRHQIRQHFSSIGYPLLGDTVYHPRAAEEDVIQRVALHAYELEIRDTASSDSDDAEWEAQVIRKRSTVISCDLPQDMQRALAILRREKREHTPQRVPRGYQRGQLKRN